MKNLNQPPTDWIATDLYNVVSSIIDGTHFTPKYVEEGVPFYSVENITSDNFVDVKYITEEEHKNLIKRCKPERGDILFTRIGSIGDCKFIDWDIDASIYVSLALIKPKEKVFGKYIYYYLKSKGFRKEILKRSLLTAYPQKINLGEIGKAKVVIPKSYEEQKKIAEILSVVEEKISIVNSELLQTQQLKKALMQKLLLKGINSSDFKQSTLGEIPTTWHVGSLGEIAEIVMGQSPRGESYNTIGNGVPILNGPTEFTDKFPIPIQFTTEPTKFSKQGDILFCVRGSSTGRMNFSDQQYCIGRGLAAIRAKANASTPYLYYQLLNISSEILRKAKDMGSTFPNINSKELISKKIAVPPLTEQQKIAKILSTVDEKVEVIKEKKTQLDDLKDVLLNDLITGKIRVDDALKLTVV